MTRIFGTLLTITLALSSCRGGPETLPRNGTALTAQGWPVEKQWDWYRGTQGSRLLPMAWLLALEDADSGELFLRPENVERFGYLLPEIDDKVQLPIGFAIDNGPIGKGMATDIRWLPKQKANVPWVGLNCAACHTAEIRVGANTGQKLRIDGGPTIADFQTFVRSINAALAATARDNAKFERFAEAVYCTTKLERPLGAQPTRGCNVDTAVRARLRVALNGLVKRQDGIAALNETNSAYGYARLDAVGHILNKVAYLASAPGQFGGPPDAPVSYPFIWNVHQHDFVQWNGIAPNKGAKLPSGERFDVGAIVRNTSEVIGVFADVDVASRASVNGSRSSVKVASLDAMETLLSTLQSPAWPEHVWPRKSADIDLAIQIGKPLFQERCASCHMPLARTDTKTPIQAAMSPIWAVGDKPGLGTDPWMACNAFNYEALTGRMQGQKKAFIIGKERFGERAFTREMLVATGIGVLAGKKRQLLQTSIRAAFGLPRDIETVTVRLPGITGQLSDQERLRDCRANAADPLMAYKARPLNGIWATAPYLHNGSVKSLDELLLAPTQRAKQFWVGNREYDPLNVGYKDERSKYGSLFRTRDAQGNPIKGNDNAGHDYGNAQLSKEQRKALVEYMKGL